MKLLSRILLPFALTAAVATVGVASAQNGTKAAAGKMKKHGNDTVIYPKDAYKLHRRGDLGDIAVSDSIYASLKRFDLDTTQRILARDTIKVPDSLRLTDPFRFKYYIALVDSLTHVQTRDTLIQSYKRLFEAKDSVRARIDSCDWRKLDSLYSADSTFKARQAFLAWYNALSPKEQKAYDRKVRDELKRQEVDSLKKVYELNKAKKDSIRENTPRILETFAFPDSMQYRRLVTWTVNQDFHEMNPSPPDTSFNYYFYDYAFRRKDVNATWLGMAGSPVKTYNYFKQTSESGVDFWTPNEAWSYSAQTLPQYNTKTPYTELAYWGTLFATSSKESDNIHFLTTQNILPELNMRIQFDKWGGEGILTSEKTINKNFIASSNYTGKKYLMNVGFIHSRVTRDENGGIVQTDENGKEGNYWIRDTTVDSREVPVALETAESESVQNTVYLDQQLRIPFNFIEKLRAKKDSTYVINDSTMNRDITTAFIGHSTEFSAYKRKYSDIITAVDTYGRNLYSDATGNYIENYGFTSIDSLRMAKLDNKIFIKLQPWAEASPISKINVGIGDRLKWHFLQGDEGRTSGENITENNLYIYAGASGQVKKYFSWDAKANYTLIGSESADFKIEGNAVFNLFPFRRNRNSPLSIGAHVETSLLTPDYYQRHFRANHLSWDNDFGKVSTTKIQGTLDIPHWKMKAEVGYGLLANTVYYNGYGVACQEASAVNVLSASLSKDFVLARIIHLDNKILFQTSSNQSVVPVPTLAGNLKYYIQFVAARDRATRTQTILTMQIGANAWCNTPWYAPGWNPNSGVFVNQTVNKYTNGPVIDVFVNMQWKKACIFIKLENLNKGWPLEHKDYFSANHYISSPSSLKLGILWPFYAQPGKASTDGGHGHGSGSGGAAGNGQSGG